NGSDAARPGKDNPRVFAPRRPHIFCRSRFSAAAWTASVVSPTCRGIALFRLWIRSYFRLVLFQYQDDPLANKPCPGGSSADPGSVERKRIVLYQPYGLCRERLFTAAQFPGIFYLERKSRWPRSWGYVHHLNSHSGGPCHMALQSGTTRPVGHT